MKLKISNELIPLNLLVLALVIVIYLYPLTSLRIVLGLPFVLFFPGYALMAALYPRRGDINGIERLALSFGMSIAVVPLIGLALNYSPWGIRLEPILISVALFIFGNSMIAWLKRQKYSQAERFGIELDLRFSHESSSAWDRALSVGLPLAILGALGTMGYVISKPKIGEKFTEFYILGPAGKAQDYPRELVQGEKGRVIVGIINREYESTVYRVEITIGGEKVGEVKPITLNHEEKWEQEAAFVPTRTLSKQKIEFLLYKGDAAEAYRTLHLWFDVKENRL